MLVRKPDNDLIAWEGNANGDGYVMGHGDTFVATLIKTTSLTADEGFVLVDLSDTTNFPHTETGKIRLYGLEINTTIDTDGRFILYIGVITEVDDTNGSTNWLLALILEAVDNPTDSSDRRTFHFRWPNGLDLEVSGGAMVNLISNVGHSGDTTWQTDTDLDSPAGDTTSPPGAGDLVAYLDETTDGGGLKFSMTVEYVTEA